MIYFFQPSAIDGHLGKGYNHYMSLLPNDDDWACFTDQDTMFLIPDPQELLQRAVDEYPDTALFTCYTNRIRKKVQLLSGQIDHEANITVHRMRAIKQRNSLFWRSKEVNQRISGMLMMVQKKAWHQVKFNEHLEYLGVDDDFSSRILGAGMKIRLVEGLYIFHYYRLLEGDRNTNHLTKRHEATTDQYPDPHACEAGVL